MFRQVNIHSGENRIEWATRGKHWDERMYLNIHQAVSMDMFDKYNYPNKNSDFIGTPVDRDVLKTTLKSMTTWYFFK